MNRSRVLVLMAVLATAACTSDSTVATTSTTTSAVATTADTSTTSATPTSTTLATTTTETPTTRLPADACDQLDIEALQVALGVDEVSAGSPFDTNAQGSEATCRFAITYSGNLGSAFSVSMFAPPEATGAFEAATSALAVGEGDGTPISGLGTRAVLYSETETGYTALMVVEYENGTAAYAFADFDELYGSDPETGLQVTFEGVIGPLLMTIH